MPRKSEKQVIDAAIGAFTRYGYRRVSMADVAAEAGISRPTLYAFFPNKEELFRAAAMQIMERMLETVRAQAGKGRSLHRKLQGVFEIWTVQTYEMVDRTPDAKDLFESHQEFNRDVVEEAYARFEDVLCDLLCDHVKNNKEAQRVARTLSAFARGIKESARDVDDLRDLIAGIINLTVAALEKTNP